MIKHRESTLNRPPNCPKDGATSSDNDIGLYLQRRGDSKHYGPN